MAIKPPNSRRNLDIAITRVSQGKTDPQRVRLLMAKMCIRDRAKHNAFSYSILDTVVMGLNAGSSLFSAPSKADYTRAYSMLERMGIAHLAQQGCNAVSGGQLQMALIARALVSDPKILILDEPESNLDMYNQLKVVEAIERIAADRTCTCIVKTHFPDHALALSLIHILFNESI